MSNHLCNNPDCDAWTDEEHIPIIDSVLAEAKAEFNALPLEEKAKVERRWNALTEDERDELVRELELGLL